MASKVNDRMKKILSCLKDNKPLESHIKEYVSQLSIFFDTFKKKENVKDLVSVVNTFKDFLQLEIVKQVSASDYDQFLILCSEFFKDTTPMEQFKLVEPYLLSVFTYSYVVRLNKSKTDAMNLNVFDFIGNPDNINRDIYAIFLKACIELDDQQFALYFSDFSKAADTNTELLNEFKTQYPKVIPNIQITQTTIHNALFIFLDLFVPAIPTQSSFGRIRIIWNKLDHNRVNYFIRQFQEHAERTQCEYYSYFYLMFLLDMKITDVSKWKDAFESCRTIAPFYFGKFIGILYFKDLFDISYDHIFHMAENEAQISKTLSPRRVEFVKKFKNFISNPFKSAMELQVTSIDHKLIDFDSGVSKSTFKPEIFKALCGTHYEPFLIGFLSVSHYLLNIIPPMPHKPLSSIFQLTLPPLFNSISNNAHSDFKEQFLSTAIAIFNDPTIYRVVEPKIFEIYIESLLVNLFHNESSIKRLALEGACNCIRLAQPGFQLLVQPFLFLVKPHSAKKSSKSDTSNKRRSNAFLMLEKRMNMKEQQFDGKFYAFVSLASMNCKGDREKALQILDSKLTKDQSNILEFKKFKESSKIDLVHVVLRCFEKVNTQYLNNAFSCIVQIILEYAVQNIDTSELEEALINRFDSYDNDIYQMLPSMCNFDSVIPNLLTRLLEKLIEKDAVQHSDIIAHVLLNVTSINLGKQLKMYVNKIKNETTQDCKQCIADLLANYKRYPYMNGISLADSTIPPILEKSKSSYCFTTNKNSIITGRTEKDHSIITSFQVSAKSSFKVQSQPCEEYQYQSDLTCDLEKPEIPDFYDVDLVSPIKVNIDKFMSKHQAEPITIPCVEDKSCKEKYEDVNIDAFDAMQELSMIKNGNLLPNTNNMPGLINSVYSWPSRYTHKIGVVYVTQNIRNQKDVLALDAGSQKFYDFLKDFGYHIDINCHLGYTGGLDTFHNTTGPSSIYHADATNETMFHVSTLMKSSNDDQNVYKKRHIGNDNVHVIFTEDCQLYDHEMIVSQFNHAHIILYPRSDRFTVMNSMRKDNVAFYGLICGAVIHRNEIISPLARTTAIEADRVARRDLVVKHGVPESLAHQIIPLALPEEQTVDKLESNMI